ncbi:hypothetical protein GQX73_g3463 [Xylaria multiplex]|uniref:Uncharacterized protein n=1 Tax=Xylaria multiplex TaxID=323545 RepID=A0A7C8N0I4_9PEZI|nr:hypothetical protein GQX73_g3463 [Xylaria multiplex]
MTENPTPQRRRFNDLVAAVDNLEAAFSKQFKDEKKKGDANPDAYFLWTYESIVDTLDRITREKWKDDVDSDLKDKLDNLFTGALGLLPKSVEYVRKTGPRLGRLHKELLAAMLLLAGRADVTTANELGQHIAAMADQLFRIKPPPRAAWNKDTKDLNQCDELEGIFQAFLALKKDPHNKQTDHELYVTESYQLLGRALRALSLPEHQAYPGDEFFKNESRPTFVEYPYGSNEFFYGRGTRPGILHIKSRLGARLTAEERKILHGDKEQPKEEKKVKKEKVGAAKKEANRKRGLQGSSTNKGEGK